MHFLAPTIFGAAPPLSISSFQLVRAAKNDLFFAALFLVQKNN
ncbi:hypothetical protein SGRA_0292 [Saprospira grandis str. Lewin]|uniref:Uncharacterized protein n=1 Tax=Saprospira grandis (strain Lewin) TaxID=984262 RepID=H6L7J9_SAPGL|nr:hypothetical protein SGRA_0292 [Saprospira grandis str. Lewin]